MEKVDIAIGVVGLVALLVTGLGVALYDDGQTAYSVVMTETDLGTMGPEAAAAAGTDFTFDAPNNTVGATFTVDVAASGQLVNPQGQVTVTIVLEGPDGSSTELVDTFTFSAGGASFTITNEAPWAETPADFEGDADDVESMQVHWDEPITVSVYVDGPGASPLPLPSDDTYTATVSGTAHTYTIIVDTPDVGTA